MKIALAPADLPYRMKHHRQTQLQGALTNATSGSSFAVIPTPRGRMGVIDLEQLVISENGPMSSDRTRSVC